MNQKPLVTVICTCFNHEDFIIETIKSVQNQSYSNIEIIIIDDYSSDKSVPVILDFLKIYPEITFLKNNQNIGNTKTFNKAAKYANGTFLIDLSCDDILLPTCVETLVKAFLKTDLNTTGIVFGNAEIIDKNGKHISDFFKTNNNRQVLDKSLFKTDLVRLLSGGPVVNSVSAMINKTIFDKLNGYNETLAFEDFDFWIRVLENNKIEFIDEFLTQKRYLNTSLGNQFFKKNKTADRVDLSMNKIYTNVISKYKTNPEILKAVLKRIHFSIVQTLKNKKIKFAFLFGLQKLKIHYFLFFIK